MKEYRKYSLIGGQIADAGTQWMSEEDVVLWAQIKDYALIEAGKEPSNLEELTIKNGQLVRASDEVIAQRQALRQAAQADAEIAELRAYLTSTDYTAIKCGELGQSMAEAYPDVHAQRTAARARINELQEGDKK